VLPNNTLKVLANDTKQSASTFFTVTGCRYIYPWLVLLCVCFALSLPRCLTAQEAILPLGEDLSGQGGQVSYSLGQLASHHHELPEVHVLQGVQQPYEYLAVDIPPTEGISLRFIVYPNPTTGIAYLEIKPFENNDLHYHLHDFNGREITSDKIRQQVTLIPTASLPPGTYILRISQQQQTRKALKIIKHP